MKIYTITAVLCFAATALATQGSSNNIREERQNKLARRAEYPKGVQRHENQHRKRHNEHGVEAHKDGRKHSSKNHDDNDEEDGKESKDEDHKSKSDDGGKDKEDKEADTEKEGEEKKQQGDEGKKVSGGKDGEEAKGEDKKNGGEGKSADSDAKKGGNAGAAPADGKKPVAGAPATGAPAAGAPAAGSPTNPATNPNIPRANSSPLWLVQPFGASIWEQGRAYVISWGPNPDPLYAKKLADKSPVDIHLMQGPPDGLKEVALLKKDADSSLNSFQWTVPTTVTPAKDYSIRLINQGQVETYSHYFEVVPAGDPRSSKSNVGEPLQMPTKGDVSQPQKSPTKPAAPPNPLPADKAASPAAKPAAHASAAVGVQSANMLAFAMTLFGAVYLL
ncbi:hypothetical protein CPC16_008849 [Podila verticillata]|nr:hypothetical protein CPC16_008849 [Podila verticillata]KFH72390.1 hypothetical protein MVEG_02681 [Podila verticillata NRRL 6337]